MLEIARHEVKSSVMIIPVHNKFHIYIYVYIYNIIFVSYLFINVSPPDSTMSANVLTARSDDALAKSHKVLAAQPALPRHMAMEFE